MKKFWPLAIIAGFALLLFKNRRDVAEAALNEIDPNLIARPDDINLDGLFHDWGGKTNLDWRLLKAIGWVESKLNPDAIGPMGEYGIMQVLCPQTLYLANWPPSDCAELFDPDYNIQIGSRILEYNVSTHGARKGIAMYNNYSGNIEADKTGPFANPDYVSAVVIKAGEYGYLVP